MQSIAEKIGCTGETMRSWVKSAERKNDPVARIQDSRNERLKELERENRELKKVNDILRKASAFFAQAELDRK